MDSNPRSLVSEATALSTVPQPLPRISFLQRQNRQYEENVVRYYLHVWKLAEVVSAFSNICKWYSALHS